MAILTEQEAAEALDYTCADDMPPKVMSIGVPLIEGALTEATGKRWSDDDPVDPLAKGVAQMLLRRWFEDEKLFDEPLIIMIGQLAAKAKAGG